MRPPNVALATSTLLHTGVAVADRTGCEPLGFGIEAQDRVRSPVVDPHGIGVIDVDRVWLRPVARQMPAPPPTVVRAVVAEQISAVRTGNPQSAAAVAPDAPCSLPRHRRLAASGGAAADRNHIVAVLPGLTDEIGPALHQLPPQRQRIPAPVVTFNTRYAMTKRRLGDFPLHPMIAAPVPEG